MRTALFVVTLVAAFEAGRIMPTDSRGALPRISPAYAQVADVCSAVDPASPQAADCRAFDALIDRIASTSLQQLGLGLAERTAPLHGQLLPLLQAATQERLGDDLDQVRLRVADTQALALRAQNLLGPTRDTLDRSEKLLDESKDLLDDASNTLDDAKDLLDESNNTLDDAKDLLDETKDTLDRTEEDMERGQELSDRLNQDIAVIQAILDKIGGPCP